MNTLTSYNSTLGERGWAFAGLASSIGTGGGGKVAITGLKGASKIFTPDQAVLIELAKDVEKSGVSVEDAKTLVNWAKEFGIKAHGIMSHENRGYWKFDHIKILNIHIPINQ